MDDFVNLMPFVRVAISVSDEMSKFYSGSFAKIWKAPTFYRVYRSRLPKPDLEGDVEL